MQCQQLTCNTIHYIIQITILKNIFCYSSMKQLWLWPSACQAFKLETRSASSKIWVLIRATLLLALLGLSYRYGDQVHVCSKGGVTFANWKFCLAHMVHLEQRPMPLKLGLLENFG